MGLQRSREYEIDVEESPIQSLYNEEEKGVWTHRHAH